MEFEVLGPIRIRDAAGVVVAPAGRLQRVLLGVLLARADQPVSADALVDALWDGQPDARAGQRLQLHVHKLRRVLGDPARLTFGLGGYRLRVHPGELDAERFVSLVDEAARAEPRRCAELIRAALALWRGTPYDDLDVPLLADEAKRLGEYRLAALERLYEAELASGRHVAITAELADLARQHPLRERLHGLLMVALYRGGRQADALEVYRTVRQAAVDELGLEPGPELRELERRILEGESIPVPAGVAPASVPAQLPHNVRGFVGRDAELSELDALLAGGADAASICVLAGTAGVGKTALAVRWAHRVLDRFPDGQLYVDLRGYGPEQPVAPEDVLAAFLRALGVEGAGIPRDQSERSALFRTLVAGRRMLVLLDNARSAEQVRPLLPGTPSVFALVTSRDSLAGLVAREGAHRTVLGRLPAAESLDLLRAVAGEAPAALGVLVELCARLPLALRIAAELLRIRRGGTAAELVAELADEQHRLDLLDADGDPHTAARAVFSWSYQYLPAEAARLFRLCGLHPGHDMDIHAMAALAGTDLPATRRALDALVRAHLVEEPTAGRYQLHDLLRDYAAELARSTEDESAVRDRLCGYYQHAALRATSFVAYLTDPKPEIISPPATPVPEFSTHDDAIRWLDAERATLLVLADGATHGVDPGRAMNLATILARYVVLGGHLDAALTMHTRALTAARQHGLARQEAHAAYWLGVVNYRLGRLDQAMSHAEHAIGRYRSLGDVNGESAVLSCLGVVHALSGRLHDAARHFTEVNALRASVGLPPSVIDLANLGRYHRFVGDYELAKHHLTTAVDLAEQSGVQAARATASFQLAGLRMDTGHLDEALELLNYVLTLAQGNRTREGNTLVTLGVVHCRRGDIATSLRNLHAALAIGRTIGDRHLIAQALNALGATHAQAGAPADALLAYDDALGVSSASHDRLEQANAHAGLGDAHAELGSPCAAADHWRQALALYRDLGVPQAHDVAAKLVAVEQNARKVAGRH